MSEEVNGQIRYTAKELFEKIDGKLDVIDGKLDDKVSQADFATLTEQVRVLEYESVKEKALEDFKTSQSHKLWGQGIGLTVIIVAINLTVYFLGAH